MLDGRRGRVEHSKFSFEHQKSSKTAAAGGARAARSRRPRRGDQGRRPWRRGPAQSRGEPPGHGRGARKRLHRQEAMPCSAARSGDRRATLRTARKPATRKGNAVICCATAGPPCNASNARVSARSAYHASRKATRNRLWWREGSRVLNPAVLQCSSQSARPGPVLHFFLMRRTSSSTVCSPVVAIGILPRGGEGEKPPASETIRCPHASASVMTKRASLKKCCLARRNRPPMVPKASRRCLPRSANASSRRRRRPAPRQWGEILPRGWHNRDVHSGERDLRSRGAPGGAGLGGHLECVVLQKHQSRAAW